LELDPLRLPERRDGTLDQDPVGNQNPVGPTDQGRVEEAELANHPVELTGQRPGLQPDPLAHAEGAICDQHHPGEQVAEHLLCGEPDDDRGESPADRQRARPEPGDPQRDNDHHQDRQQANEEADRPGGSGVEAPIERRGEPLAE
jgi:hypothetical protein